MMEAMVVSALDSAKAAERYGLRADQIILSAKVSGVRDLIDVYTNLAARCEYALHLGLTEAGMGAKGLIASTAGPGAAAAGRHRRHHPREPDAEAGRRPDGRSAGGAADSAVAEHSQLHAPGDELPGCGRTTSTYFQELAEQIQSYLRTSMPEWRKKLSRRGRAQAGGDGLRGQRPRRIEARQPRHQPAGHV